MPLPPDPVYNEKAVGRAIQSCGIPREERFIATKAYIQQWDMKK